MNPNSSYWFIEGDVAYHSYLSTPDGNPYTISATSVPIVSLMTWCAVKPYYYLQTYVRGTVQLHRLLLILDWCQITSEYFLQLTKNQQEHLIAQLFDLFGNTDKLSDHANGKTYDNRDPNLGPANNLQSAWNTKQRIDSKYPYLHIMQNTCEKWFGYCITNGEILKTAEFGTPKEAAKAIDLEVLNARGFFAVLNCDPDKPMGDKCENFRVRIQSKEWLKIHKIEIPWYLQ